MSDDVRWILPEDAEAFAREFEGRLGVMDDGAADGSLAAVLVRVLDVHDLLKLQLYRIADGGVGEPIAQVLIRPQDLRELVENPIEP